jgi:acetolactate synthase-1/2/3 large subunit
MNGAECLLRTLAVNGVRICFMNPGTSEMQLVAALDRVPEVRGVLCLFEGVCSGAADGYARMARHPAATVLHLGPGLGNALSNLHNARKAYSPVVNIVGEHSTQHLQYDAPLSADIELFARTVSGYVRTPAVVDDIGDAAADVIAAAVRPPGQVATLLVPADYSWTETSSAPRTITPAPAPPPSADCVRLAAHVLRSGAPAGLLLGGRTLTGAGLSAAGRISAATGAKVFAARYAARMQSGRGLFQPKRIPYFPEVALPLLSGLQHLFVVEAKAPVSFFGYPDMPSYLAPPDCAVHDLASIDQDGTAALEALSDEIGARNNASSAQTGPRPVAPTEGALNPDVIGRTVAALMPENAIVSDEMVSSGEAVWCHLLNAPPYEHLPVTGGSIGQGLPVAAGAAFACPGRKVIALEADGSGMYTPQTLWTMAREDLDIAVVIFANRRYRILDIEMRRTNAIGFGAAAEQMIDIANPALDWVQLSEAMGVPATRATTAAEFTAQFQTAMHERGPRLIEAVIQ